MEFDRVACARQGLSFLTVYLVIYHWGYFLASRQEDDHLFRGFLWSGIGFGTGNLVLQLLSIKWSFFQHVYEMSLFPLVWSSLGALLFNYSYLDNLSESQNEPAGIRFLLEVLYGGQIFLLLVFLSVGIFTLEKVSNQGEEVSENQAEGHPSAPLERSIPI